MRFGDLSNQVVPRIVIVFEGALGFLAEARLGEYNRLGSAGRWDRAVACWDLNEIMTRALTDLTVRRDVQAEVVTYAGPEEMAGALARRFDDEGLVVSRVTASTPARMVRRLAYAPDIARVYDADPAHVLAYGSKGVLLRSAADLGR